MDLRHLRTFVAVADEGTVSQAALRLHIAQPALSRQIRDLEEELGVQLFERVRRRLVLTGEGEQLLGDCRAVLGAIHSLIERSKLLRRQEGGILRVAATPQMIERVFSGFLHRYGARRPDVQIKLSDAAGGKALTMLERGELHLGIGLKRAIEYDPQAFDSMDLPPVEFIAAYRSSLFKLGAGPNVEITGLAPYPLLPIGAAFWIRQTFDAACRLAGIKPRIFMESNTPHTLLALAENGHGIAILPSIVPTSRYRLETRRIAHARKPLREPLAVLWDRRRALPPYAKDFCDHLAAYMRQVFSVSTRGSRSA